MEKCLGLSLGRQHWTIGLTHIFSAELTGSNKCYIIVNVDHLLRSLDLGVHMHTVWFLFCLNVIDTGPCVCRKKVVLLKFESSECVRMAYLALRLGFFCSFVNWSADLHTSLYCLLMDFVSRFMLKILLFWQIMPSSCSSLPGGVIETLVLELGSSTTSSSLNSCMNISVFNTHLCHNPLYKWSLYFFLKISQHLDLPIAL